MSIVDSPQISTLPDSESGHPPRRGWGPYRPNPHPPGSIETALTREILRSERLRITILAVILAGVLTAYIVVSVVAPGIPRVIFPGLNPLVPILVSAAALAYELVARAVVGYLIRTDRELPTVPRFGNALIETSLPSLAIITLASSNEPVLALFTPAAAFYYVFIIAATLRLDFKLCVWTGLVAAVEYFALAQVLIARSPASTLPTQLTAVIPHFDRGVELLVAGLIAGLVSLRIKRQFINSLRSMEERNRVVSMFGQHVSPAVVDKLMSQEVELEGEVRHVCLMFLDIRNFTSYAENRSPEEVVGYLNSLFDFMIESVNRHHGIVNKFLGDGFLAVFGAPISDGRDSQNAVAAALEIIEQVERHSASGAIPPTRIGIGLHAGEAVTGNIGSALRKEYTIIGDAVNLASRIEQLNKQFGSQLLISAAVLEAIGEQGLAAHSLGPIEVKGHTAPVPVFSLA